MEEEEEEVEEKEEEVEEKEEEGEEEEEEEAMMSSIGPKPLEMYDHAERVYNLMVARRRQEADELRDRLVAQAGLLSKPLTWRSSHISQYT